jgi:hypothetical protein
MPTLLGAWMPVRWRPSLTGLKQFPETTSSHSCLRSQHPGRRQIANSKRLVSFLSGVHRLWRPDFEL